MLGHVLNYASRDRALCYSKSSHFYLLVGHGLCCSGVACGCEMFNSKTSKVCSWGWRWGRGLGQLDSVNAGEWTAFTMGKHLVPLMQNTQEESVCLQMVHLPWGREGKPCALGLRLNAVHQDRCDAVEEYGNRGYSDVNDAGLIIPWGVPSTAPNGHLHQLWGKLELRTSVRPSTN